MREAFAKAVQTAIEESIVIGYTPSLLIQMLQRQHAVEIAKQLIANGNIQHGFNQIIQLRRPDLTIESLMLQSQFTGLFSRQELEAARWRLNQAGVIV